MTLAAEYLERSTHLMPIGDYFVYAPSQWFLQKKSFKIEICSSVRQSKTKFVSHNTHKAFIPDQIKIKEFIITTNKHHT